MAKRIRALSAEERTALACGTAAPWLQWHAADYIHQLECDLGDSDSALVQISEALKARNSRP